MRSEEKVEDYLYFHEMLEFLLFVCVDVCLKGICCKKMQALVMLLSWMHSFTGVLGFFG